MSDPATSTTTALGPAPTRRPLPVPGPVEDLQQLRPLAAEVETAADAAGADGGWVCPHCSAVLEAGARFCEVCGYDPSTGSLPHLRAPEIRPAEVPASASPPPPDSTTGRVVIVITADPDYYARHGIEEILFPVAVPPRTIELPAGPVSIGRRSRSRGTNPSVDLTGPPEDPAVSHTHASLVPNDDGTWALVDHGSTNGTYLNDAPDAVPANRPLPISPGDRIYVGAWTRITLELRPTD